jgi:hypothetical protein
MHIVLFLLFGLLVGALARLIVPGANRVSEFWAHSWEDSSRACSDGTARVSSLVS